jgi:hypothetical protein
MSTRFCQDWIESYLKMVKETEPAVRFHRWVAITILAAMLGRKCEIEFGPEILHPNLYVILVGPPGIRKTVSIRYGESLVGDVIEVNRYTPAPNVTTRQAFYKRIEGAEVVDYTEDGQPFVHSSLFVVAKELVQLLGENDTNQRIADLCGLYDGDPQFLYETRTQGITHAVKPSVWLLAATTPNWIQISMPQLAVGGGMTSRTIFVVSQTKGKHIAYPDLPPFDPELRGKLVYDLAEIKKLCGKFTFDPNATNYFRDWYHKAFPHHGIKDQRLLSYVNRLPSMIVKVAMVLSAARRGDGVITVNDLSLTVRYFSDLHKTMPLAFGGQGLSNLGAQTNLVKDLLRERSIISEAEILDTLDMHISKYELERIKETLMGSKFCYIDKQHGEKYWLLTKKSEEEA